MKLTIAITFAALLTGCAAEEDTIDVSNDDSDGIETVVIEPIDLAEVKEPSAARRPAPQHGDYALDDSADNGSKDDFRPLPGRPPFSAGDSGADLADTLLDRMDRQALPSENVLADPTETFAREEPCSCESTECLEDWIAANLGCNVCATFVCSDDSNAGACYLCKDE